MTDTEQEMVGMLVDAAADSERRLEDIRAGRKAFEPGQARELFYVLRGMIRSTDHDLSRMDGFGSECWSEMHAVQQRLAEHLDDLRNFL